jgi:hypothetical protein
MNKSWFKVFGWIYRPVSWEGMTLVLLSVAFCVQVFVAVDRHSHSVSDTLFGIFPYFTSSFLLLNWIAAKTTEPSRTQPLKERSH